MKQRAYSFVMKRIIDISLFLLFVCIPLIVNPFAFDVWYKPKINAVYLLIVIITLSVSFRHLFLKYPLRFKSIPVLIPLIAYAGVTIISTVFSISPRLSLFGDIIRKESMFTILAYVMLTFLFSQYVETERQYRSLLQGLLFSSLLISINGILNYLGYYPIKQLVPFSGREGPGVGSLIGNPNFLGKYLVIIVPLFIAYYFSARKVTLNIIYSAGFMLCLCALILTFTRASWLGFLIEFVIFGLLTGKEILRESKKKIFASMLLICIIASISICALLPKKEGYFFNDVKDSIHSTFDFKKGTGVATRLFLWEKAIEIIKKRPLVGYGPDTNGLAMQSYNLEYCMKFNDWKKYMEEGKEKIKFYNWTVIDRAHNNYLDIAIALGLIGLAAYMSIIITFLIWLWRTVKSEEDFFKRIIFCGILASFCGCLVNDLFIFSIVSVSPTFWSLMGLTLAMKNIDKKTNYNVFTNSS